MSRNEINKQSIWHHSISKVNSKLNFCRFIDFVTYMMFLMISWNITTCCVNCNLVKEGVTELLDTNKIPYLLHHLDYWLSFCIPTWESKSVWINRSHIREQHKWAILFCSLQVLSSHSFSGWESFISHCLHNKKRCDFDPIYLIFQT